MISVGTRVRSKRTGTCGTIVGVYSAENGADREDSVFIDWDSGNTALRWTMKGCLKASRVLFAKLRVSMMITDARSARKASFARQQLEETAKIQFILDAIEKHTASSSYRSVKVAIDLCVACDTCAILKDRGFSYSAEGIRNEDLYKYRGSDRTHIFTISWSDN